MRAFDRHVSIYEISEEELPSYPSPEDFCERAYLEAERDEALLKHLAFHLNKEKRLATRWRSLSPLSRRKELMRRHLDELRPIVAKHATQK